MGKYTKETGIMSYYEVRRSLFFVSCCVVLYCIELNCIELNSNALHNSVLHCIVSVYFYKSCCFLFVHACYDEHTHTFIYLKEHVHMEKFELTHALPYC